MSKQKKIMELVAKAAQAFLDFEKRDREIKKEAEGLYKVIMEKLQKRDILEALKKIDEI